MDVPLPCEILELQVLQTPPTCSLSKKNRLRFPTALLTATCTWCYKLERSAADLPTSSKCYNSNKEQEYTLELTHLLLHFSNRIILLMVQKSQTTTWDVENLMNNGINYQAQLVGRISEPSTVRHQPRSAGSLPALSVSLLLQLADLLLVDAPLGRIKSSMIRHRLRIFPFPIGSRQIYTCIYIYVYTYINLYTSLSSTFFIFQNYVECTEPKYLPISLNCLLHNTRLPWNSPKPYRY